MQRLPSLVAARCPSWSAAPRAPAAPRSQPSPPPSTASPSRGTSPHRRPDHRHLGPRRPPADQLPRHPARHHRPLQDRAVRRRRSLEQRDARRPAGPRSSRSRSGRSCRSGRCAGSSSCPSGAVKERVKLSEGRPIDRAAVEQVAGRHRFALHASQGYYAAQVKAIEMPQRLGQRAASSSTSRKANRVAISQVVDRRQQAVRRQGARQAHGHPARGLLVVPEGRVRRRQGASRTCASACPPGTATRASSTSR